MFLSMKYFFKKFFGTKIEKKKRKIKEKILKKFEKILKKFEKI